MGIYTPLITCCFGLYIWCAAVDPADLGVFNPKKYHKILENGKYSGPKDSKFGGDSAATFHDDNDTSFGGKTVEKDAAVTDETLKDTSAEIEGNNGLPKQSSCLLWIFSPCAIICRCTGSHEESSEQQMNEDGMFYCSLCEVEAGKSLAPLKFYLSFLLLPDDYYIMILISRLHMKGKLHINSLVCKKNCGKRISWNEPCFI